MINHSASRWCLTLAAVTLPLVAQQASNDGLKLPTREAATGVTGVPRPNLTLEQRGDIYMARKMYREAVEIYQQAPNSAILANKIGIAYHQLTFLPQARKQYEKAQKLDAKYAEAINNLGTVHYAQKNYRKAISQYKKALELTPNSASIHSNLGTAYFARKKYGDAFREYQTALSLDPEVFEHRNSHGVLLQERSVDERAKFYFYLAKTYAKSGNTERALLYIRKAIESGFKERGKFADDSDFQAMQPLPEFQELLKLEARAL
ncbi:MAG: tetratricopeptide repeat protein [Bryobacterales bacterium]|nr:tetratricopeptide repeat protein [Bryobacterales bacterium]